ncbi:DNA-binding transcriptional regulator, LysR family [Parafrankia irregularis]|uniref:DNA-binding transcriptional regulator, LysR family n=1 Tax=Parafrankia irregularis TaxID=795642 RepID=A0A0S4QG63_9ACTN|nr:MULTISPECIES: LysR substrate-binding domain-containing protein [Parafrankia]MBE3201066.1 LysR family transcriptional regulator [Parafrankia sp. CH37]CUU54533.1 DNA-binding transcriptional regulator, LysR family [Parafrankia irregularis]
MELRYLTSFLAIAEELHFGRAAARLHLAQPSLSQQLQRLERDIGVELVSRSSHEVKLTAAGRAFEVEARRLLDATRRAVTVAREAASGRTGMISIGFNYPAGQRVLQPTLLRLAADYPGVSTTLWEARSGPQLSALAEGRLDVALVFAGPPSAQLRSQRVATIPLVAVVSRRHPWATRSEVPFRELADQPCVLFRREQSPAMHDAILAAADRCGIALTISDEVDDSGATGIVVTTRPVVGFASAARGAHPPGHGLSAVRLVDPVPTVGMYAVWRPDPQPVVGAFLDCLEAAGPFSEQAADHGSARAGTAPSPTAPSRAAPSAAVPSGAVPSARVPRA